MKKNVGVTRRVPRGRRILPTWAADVLVDVDSDRIVPSNIPHIVEDASCGQGLWSQRPPQNFIPVDVDVVVDVDVDVDVDGGFDVGVDVNVDVAVNVAVDVAVQLHFARSGRCH